MTYQSIETLVARMREGLAELQARRSARRFFHATYLRTTRAVGEEIERGGFADGEWLTRWDIAFAELYLDALEADRQGAPVSGPWRVALSTPGQGPPLPPPRHLPFALHAHAH